MPLLLTQPNPSKDKHRFLIKKLGVKFREYARTSSHPSPHKSKGEDYLSEW